MPIYEFYCWKCNTIYNFFTRTVNTDKVPYCPRCKDVKLKRKVSIFVTISGDKEETQEDEGLPPIDEAKMEKAMGILAREADRIDADDPRQGAQLMRRLAEETGLKLGPGMEEALSRMERGEDPEKIEEELGSALEEEEPFLLNQGSKVKSPRPRPKVDDTLYEL